MSYEEAQAELALLRANIKRLQREVHQLRIIRECAENVMLARDWDMKPPDKDVMQLRAAINVSRDIDT